MLHLSKDKTKYICTDAEGNPCFSRGEHVREAREQGLDLDQMFSLTMAFKYTGKGKSISQYLEEN